MITINEQQVEFQDGMTVADALQKAGESTDRMTLVVVEGRVLPISELQREKLTDGMNIKLLPILSGG